MSIAGCAAEPETATASAHVQIQVPEAFAGAIARMTVQIDGGDEVALDSTMAGHSGVLMVPAGLRTFVGRAYDASGAIVGQSQPLQATIASGVVQGVQLMILDVTTQTPSQFGPAIISLTYPETGEVNQPFEMSIVAVNPAGHPVALQWTTTCADAVFTDAAAATTSWSRSNVGGCTIGVTASSDGFTANRTFNVFAFPAGSQQGAVQVNGTFVSAPASPQLTLSSSTGTCVVTAGTANSTCENLVRPGEYLNWNVYAYDGNYNTAGITDSCGGTFYTQYDSGYQKGGYWSTPAGATTCLVTATSTNASGARSQVQAGIVFRRE